MLTHPVWSLKSPWWARWGLERLKKESPIGRASKELWTQRFAVIYERLEWGYGYAARRAGMTYKQFFERRMGQVYENSSPPMHELYLLANALNVEVIEIIPTCRELFTHATKLLIDDYHEANPDAPPFALAPAAPAAYAEYFCAAPDPKARGLVDRAAAQRACRALDGQLKNVDETIDVLIAIGTAIDIIHSTLQGEPA